MHAIANKNPAPRRAFPLLLSAAAIAVLAGCKVGPDYKSPDTRVSGAFAATQASTQAATAPAVDLATWWETFDDPMLDKLINRAVESNLDIQLATARLRQAREELGFNRAGLFPTVDASALFSRSRRSRNTQASVPVNSGGDVNSGGSGGTGTGGTGTGGTGTGGTGTGGGAVGGGGSTGGGGGGGVATPSSFGAGTTNLWQAGFDAGWELDVFGGTRRAIESANYALQAQVEARRNTLVTLLAEVAQNYIMLRGYQHELDIVKRNVAAQLDSLQLQQQKLQAGIATDLTVAQAEALLASTRAQMPPLERDILQSIHRLGVLLGQEPTSLLAELEPMSELPSGPPAVPPGLPSELLRRRPDVRQAERQLAVATANIGVATADLFPRFSLTGSIGLSSLKFSHLFDAQSRFWSFGPGVSWRIFDAGQIGANIRIQNALQEQAFIQYRQAVLQALSDVENSLVAYDREQARREHLQQAVAANRRAVDLARQLYDAGVVDYLNVLTAQQSLFDSEDQLAQSDQIVSTNLVALYKALGGGWEMLEADAGAGEAQIMQQLPR